MALRSSAIDHNGRFCMSSAVAAGSRAVGMDRGLPFPLAGIPAADVVLLVGANPADTMPPAMRFFAEGRDRGARHIVVDPRRTATAELAHRHLQPVPGTDLSLANGMLHIAIRDGLVDEPYIGARTSGFAMVRYARRHRSAVVISGGLLGLEAAHGLQRHGLRVHANIQRDGTFPVVPRISGGVTDAAQLRRSPTSPTGPPSR